MEERPSSKYQSVRGNLGVLRPKQTVEPKTYSRRAENELPGVDQTGRINPAKPVEKGVILSLLEDYLENIPP